MRFFLVGVCLLLLVGCGPTQPATVQTPPALPPALPPSPPAPDLSEYRPDQVFHNPVDQKTYLSQEGWKFIYPSKPSSDQPGEVVKMRLLRLLTSTDELEQRVSYDDLLVFSTEAVRLGKEIFGKSDQQFKVTAQFNCTRSGFKVTMTAAGSAPEELLQSYYDAAIRIKKLPVKADEVAFQVNFDVNLGPTGEPPPPPAPDGYRWQELTEIKGAVLFPDGWFFRSTEKHGTRTYQITKEETDDEKQFDTGLTINVAQNVKAKTKGSPLEHALRHIGAYSKGAETVVKPDFDKVGPFQRVFCEIRKQYFDTGERQFRIRIEALISESTDTLYLIHFGAQDDEWDTAWQTGKTLIDGLVLPEDQ